MNNRITKANYVPNPQIIVFNTNWNIENHSSLFLILENLEGVENANQFAVHKYSFHVEIGELFDRDEMRDIILAKIEEYFND